MYLLFKTVHVMAAIAWLGAALAFQIMNVRVARTAPAAATTPAGDASGPSSGGAVGFLAEQGSWFGQRYFSVAGFTTLLSGIVMVVVSDGLSFGDPWITVGFVGIAASIFIGAVPISRTTEGLVEAVTVGDPDRTRAAQQRLTMLGAIDLLIVFSVVAVMVYKPG